MKKYIVRIIICFTLALIFAALPEALAKEKPAAAIKISKKSAAISVGDSLTLKVNGTSKTPVWTTSNKAVATVSSNGKVTGKKAGTVKITAAVNGVRYTSSIRVIKSSFPVKQAALNSLTTVVPKDWSIKAEDLNPGAETDDLPAIKQLTAAPKKASGSKSSVTMILYGTETVPTITSKDKEDMQTARELSKGSYSYELLSYRLKESLSSQLKASGSDIRMYNHRQSDFSSKAGTALQSEISATITTKTSYGEKSQKLKYTCYSLMTYISNTFICADIYITDYYDSKINLDELGRLMLDSITIR